MESQYYPGEVVPEDRFPVATPSFAPKREYLSLTSGVGRGEEEQPGRVPGAPAGADAAPLVPRQETGGPRAAVRIRPRLRGAHRQRPQDLRSRAGAGIHQLHEDGALHRRRRDRRVRQGENVIAAELGSGHFDDAARTWDWGWEEAEWRATPRLRVDLRITYLDGSEEISRRMDRGRSAPMVRRATTATTSARPTTPGAGCRDGTGPASTTRPGRQRASSPDRPA